MRLMEFRAKPPYEADIPESRIEAYLVMCARIHGGIAIKNDAKLRRGIPDRTLIMPGGVVVFVEMKKRGNPLTTAQERRMKELLAMDQNCAVVDYKKGCIDLINWCQAFDAGEWWC